MGPEKNENSSNQSEEIKVDDIIKKIRLFLAYIKSRWIQLLVYTIIGAILGLSYSLLSKPKYTAVCTFVLDEGDKGGMLSQYAGLASLAGIDVNSGGGIFKGDNILELYKSRLMLEKTLLTVANFNGTKQKLIYRYINQNNLLKQWKNDDRIDHIDFEGDPKGFNRKQDSIITDLSDIFNKKNLDVSKPDKKLGIIRIAFTCKDELFAKEFADKLVKNVNEFYSDTKTKKISKSMAILQRQADSVKNVLNSSIYGAATALDLAPNANPALFSLRVPSQKKQVDVQSNTAIYAEIVKNLEVSKISLIQQTPLIQLLDQPVLPLKILRVTEATGIVIGAILGFFLAMGLITLKLFKIKYLTFD